MDIGIENVVLSNHLLQDVANTSREDQQRDLLLRQMVEKQFVAVPKEIRHTQTVLFQPNTVRMSLIYLCSKRPPAVLMFG